MPRIALEDGQNSIATSTAKRVDPETNQVLPNQRGRGTWTLQWYANVGGKTKRYFTRVKDGTKSDCYAAARKRFQRLVEDAKLPGDGEWLKSSPMSDFVERYCIPAVEANEYSKPLRPRTITQYTIRLQHFANQVGETRIADTCVPATLERHFKAIAKEHGNETSKYVAKAVAKYVYDPLVMLRVIDDNPMRGRAFEVTVRERVDRVDPDDDGDMDAPTPDERKRVIDHLLGLDPTVLSKQGVSGKQATAKRSNLVDITLLQATTGLRIREARTLTRAAVRDENGLLAVTVTEAISKTHKSRTVPITDERVADRMRERLSRLPDAPGTPVFPAPGTGGLWDENNARKALRKFYDELAADLDMPKLLRRNKVTHVWRTTLNGEMRDAGVPLEIRVAFLGHTEEVNQKSYTAKMDPALLAGIVGMAS